MHKVDVLENRVKMLDKKNDEQAIIIKEQENTIQKYKAEIMNLKNQLNHE